MMGLIAESVPSRQCHGVSTDPGPRLDAQLDRVADVFEDNLKIPNCGDSAGQERHHWVGLEFIAHTSEAESSGCLSDLQCSVH